MVHACTMFASCIAFCITPSLINAYPTLSKIFFPPNGFPVRSCILSQRTEVINQSSGVLVSVNLGNAIWIWLVEANNTAKVHDGSLVMYLLELWCLLSYNSPPCNSNLGITLVCYRILYDVVSTHLIFDMWGFLMGVGSVMVLWLVIYDAATKPRASCGRAHKVVLLGTRRYRGLLVMIHYGATLMCCLPVNLFPGYLFLSC
jgi:hypothetical protein